MQSNFMFYDNFLEAINQLPESERANACYQFCKYAITDELPEDKSLAMFCVGVRYSVHKYQGRGGARVGAGRPKKSNEEENQKNQNIQKNQNTQTETETKTETEKEIHKEKESDSFVAELERQELEKTKKTTKPKKEQPKILYTGKHEYLKAQIERWLEYKQSRKEMYKSPQSVLVCVKRLHELCGGDVSVAEKIIDQSIGNNWAGLFALKQQPQKAKSISSPDYVGEGSFLRRAEDDPFCADL